MLFIFTFLFVVGSRRSRQPLVIWMSQRCPVVYFIEGEYFDGVIPFLRCGSGSSIWCARLVVVCGVHDRTWRGCLYHNIQGLFCILYHGIQALEIVQFCLCVCKDFVFSCCTLWPFDRFACIRWAIVCGLPSLFYRLFQP